MSGDRLLLAIETATLEVGAAVGSGRAPLAAVVARPGRRHAETLHPAIEAACALAGVSLRDLDAVAVDIGPGLFTGLRVGVAAAKAIAMALGIGLVPCTSLEVLASASGAIPVVDLRRGEVAWSVPESWPGGDGEPHLGTPAELAAALATRARRGASGDGRPEVLVAGDGALRYAGELAGLLEEQGVLLHVAGDDLAAPPVGALLRLAAPRDAVDPVGVAPLYLRDADARINWTTRPVGGVAYDA